MASTQPPWDIAEFGGPLDAWIERDNPSTDLRIIVCSWILSRAVNPYQGVQREKGFPNLWWGEVPDTRHGDSAVMCSYWISEELHRVNGESIATLSWPF